MCYNGLNSGMPFPIGSAPMPRRPAALLTSPRDISNSSLFVVLDHEIEKHPFPFQLLPHSFAKTPGVSSSPFRQSFKKHFNSCRKRLCFALLHHSEARPLPFQSVAHSFCVYPGWNRSSTFHDRLLTVTTVKSRRTSTCEKNSPSAVLLLCGLIPAALPLSHRFSPHFHLPPHLLYDIARLIAHPTARRFGGPHGH